jgi:hypothetical protein
MNLKYYIRGLKIYDENIIHRYENVVPKVFIVTSLQLNISNSSVGVSIRLSAYCACRFSPTMFLYIVEF